MTNMETRYWVCEGMHICSDVKDWFGVVDENAGGIIAYFQIEEHALNFIQQMKEFNND